MAGADFLRAEYSRRNAVTQSFQCRDEHGELSVGVPRDVLAEDTMRPALARDADDLIGEEAIVGGASAFSGDAVGLARVSRSEAIHRSTPWLSVEGGKVRPDRRRMKPPAFHSRDKTRGCKGFPLHVSDAARFGHGDADAKFEPSNPGA
ncbi:MAG: hypothetical protein AAF650_02985 [Pseudomonadota bacterium]